MIKYGMCYLTCCNESTPYRGSGKEARNSRASLGVPFCTRCRLKASACKGGGDPSTLLILSELNRQIKVQKYTDWLAYLCNPPDLHVCNLVRSYCSRMSFDGYRLP